MSFGNDPRNTTSEDAGQWDRDEPGGLAEPVEEADR